MSIESLDTECLDLSCESSVIKVERELVLISKEGEQFTIKQSTASQSEVIKTISEGDKDQNEINFPTLSSFALGKVVEFMKHAQTNPMGEIEKPLRSSNMSDVVSLWYANFIELDYSGIYELLLAANYLDIKRLLNLGCVKISSMIVNKKLSEIRNTFNFTRALTIEEEAYVVCYEKKWSF